MVCRFKHGDCLDVERERDQDEFMKVLKQQKLQYQGKKASLIPKESIYPFRVKVTTLS